MGEKDQISSFFFDTYALFELINGSPSYKKYEKNINSLTTKFNLMELHYNLLRLKGKETADFYFNKFNEFCIPVDDDTIKEANELKIKISKRDVSYVDCIGYTLAKKRNAKFLTGDEQFKDLDNVEFVK